MYSIKVSFDDGKMFFNRMFRIWLDDLRKKSEYKELPGRAPEGEDSFDSTLERILKDSYPSLYIVHNYEKQSTYEFIFADESDLILFKLKEL